MSKNEIKNEEEIEKNNRGIYEVKNIKRNAKILDLNNLGVAILNFESVSKQALIRLFSNDVTYYLNQMERNKELSTLKITSLNNSGGDKIYFYESFDKKSQLKSEMISYFTYFLKENEIKYGKLTVDPATKSLSLPFVLEKESQVLKVEAEVFTLQSHELNSFDFNQTFEKLPVFVVDELFIFETIVNKSLNCIVIYVTSNGRNTELQGIYKEPSTKEEKGKALIFKDKYVNKYNAKYVTTLKNPHMINSFKNPYKEAERRSSDVKSRINSKKAL